MNRQQFIDYVKKPELLNPEAGLSLDTLLKEFPYFQTARLLQIKNLHQQNSIHYPAQLRVAAVYSSDRKVLHKLITLKPQSAGAGISEEKKEIPAPVAPEKMALKTEKERTGETGVKPVIATVSDPPVIPPVKNKLAETLKANEQEDLGEAMLEHEILLQAMTTTVELDIRRANEEKKEEIGRQQNTQEDVKEQQKKEFDPSERHDFIEWLHILGHSGPEKQIKKQSVIDAFIERGPKITKPRTDFYSPVNMAKQSVSEDPSLTTETLAGIYEKQGLYSRAIMAYETLSLKYPEKSAYFAARIQEIKKKTQQR